MPYFRKKPVTIEAVQFTGTARSARECVAFMGLDPSIGKLYRQPRTLKIDTLEGVMTASNGDWIIKGVRGEFYPCRNESFMRLTKQRER